MRAAAFSLSRPCGLGAALALVRRVIQLYCSVIVISEQNIVIRYLFSGHWDELAHIARRAAARAAAFAEICAPAGHCVYLSQSGRP